MGFVLQAQRSRIFSIKSLTKYISVYLNRGKIEMWAAHLLRSTAAFIDIFLPLTAGNK